jgi:AraC-like DNA-binding protein
MYDPVKDGVEKSVQAVSYAEVKPPDHLGELVHCYWELKTEADLAEDFTLHALPDACTNILFDQLDVRIAGVTALQTTHTTLNLGKRFHFVGIQFYPGVWRDDPEETVDHYVGEPYEGSLPLVDTGRRLATVDFADKAPIFSQLVDQLWEDDLAVPNPVTSRILTNLDEIHTVADMASIAGLSTRQLQRTLKETTGFSPHNLLKVLRLQNSFRSDYQLAFADQAHFTHSFRNATGYTPARFFKKFDV